MSAEDLTTPYYCLFCQSALDLRAIRCGAHLGHLLMEFGRAENACPDDRQIAKEFREKLQQDRKYSRR